LQLIQTLFDIFVPVVNVLGAKSGTVEDTMKSSNAALTMPRAVVHWYGKVGCTPGRKVGHINLTSDSHGELEGSLAELLALEGIPISLLPSGGKRNTCPLVGVIMGSHSDLPTMQAAVEMLRQFHVPYGGAAHLPGMVASMTPLPVIGVPVKTSTLSGVDSLYSIVQMPRGIPVATVAIGNAENAGLLAVRILSTSRLELRQKMMDYQDELTKMVDAASDKLQALGSDAFLSQMDSKNQFVNV
jgi:phosphoribosylaminoimidazole carboxylase